MRSHRLRYTGDQATTFQAPGVGYVEPGGEFTVDGSLLLSFMRRPDVSHARECPAPPCQCGEEPGPQEVSGPRPSARRSRPSASASSSSRDTP